MKSVYKKTCIIILFVLLLAACKTKHKVTDIAIVQEKIETVEAIKIDLKQFKGKIEAANIDIPIKIERTKEGATIHNAKTIDFDFTEQKTDVKKEVKQEAKIKVKKKEVKKSKPSYVFFIIALVWLFLFLKYGRQKT